MRIGYFGDGPWSHRALEAIVAMGGMEIAFVVARHQAPDPVLRQWAERLGVPFSSPKSVNAPEFLDHIAERRVDLNLSMSYDQILRRPIIESAPLGFINCHAGALPFYRGRNILNWAIINGESRFGVTVHYVDEGIDTGDIILQDFAPIGPDDDYAAILDKAYALCPSVVARALGLIAGGNPPRIVQSTIHPVGFYCGRRGPGDEIIDWTWTSQRIHDFVRGISLPGPAARTGLDDGELAVVKTRLIPGAPCYIGTPGEVVGRGADGVVVKTGDSTVLVPAAARVAPDGTLGPVETPRLRVGTRLGQTR